MDLFPPSIRDPHGVHKAIWDQFKEEPFELPSDKRLTLAAYAAGSEKVAYVENVAVGDRSRTCRFSSRPIAMSGARWKCRTR